MPINNTLISRLSNNDPKLTSLNLSKKKISAEDIYTLSTSLKNNTHLHDLNLSLNNLGSKGTTAVSHLIKLNTSLKIIDLTWSHINAQGRKALAEALENNYNIIKINGIPGNRIRRLIRRNQNRQNRPYPVSGSTITENLTIAKQITRPSPRLNPQSIQSPSNPSIRTMSETFVNPMSALQQEAQYYKEKWLAANRQLHLMNNKLTTITNQYKHLLFQNLQLNKKVEHFMTSSYQIQKTSLSATALSTNYFSLHKQPPPESTPDLQQDNAAKDWVFVN